MKRLVGRAAQAGLQALTVKAPGALTHRHLAPEPHGRQGAGPAGTRRGNAEPADRETALRTTCEGLAALTGESLFRGLLLQFPYSFHYTPANRRYLAWLVDALSPVLHPAHLFVEFRHLEWERRSVWDGLRERGALPVAVDLPPLAGLPAAFGLPGNGTDDTGTGRSLQYLRLHGRNTDTWWTGTNTTRYDYNYSSDELEDIADRIERAVPATGDGSVYVAFNNHFSAQAVRNAARLAEMLTARGLRVARPPAEPPGQLPFP